MKKLITLLLAFIICNDLFAQDMPQLPQSEYTLEVKDCIWFDTMAIATKIKLDTIREVMLVTERIPGFSHSRVGYAVVRDGRCISHLDCRKQVLKMPVVVWDCEGRKRREGR